jgi:double-strand break repair protein MRE11
VQERDWFNLMAVHQNHHAYSESGYLPENFLPDFLDFVVWGHEHECLIDPRLNTDQQFFVMQPGSSVATSLVPGEAVPKHVAIVEVTGKDFTVEKIRLKTVRPFITRDLVLAQDSRFKGVAREKGQDNRTKLTTKLIEVVNDMISEAQDEWKAINEDDLEYDDEGQPIIPLPLVRLRVEHTAPEGGKFDCENPQRFSNRFINKVANVNDVVYFHRKKSATSKLNAQFGQTSIY